MANEDKKDFNAMSVSYTHLPPDILRNFRDMAEAPLLGYGFPVSYTHLDVYKRQLQNSGEATGDLLTGLGYGPPDVYKRQLSSRPHGDTGHR